MPEDMPMVVKKRKSPVDPLPVSPMKIFAKEPQNEGGGLVESARAKFFHALTRGPSDAKSDPGSSQEDNEGNATNQDTPESTPSDLVQKTEPALLKRKKKVSQEKQAFVMKLFDRSVDLALFDETTPLFPICRAWMHNLPKKPSPKKKNKGNDKPESMEVDEDPDFNVKEILDSLNNGEEVELSRLPPPTPLTNPNDRIPSPICSEMSTLDSVISRDQDTEKLPSKESLLKEHRDKWVTIRKNWHAAERRNEDRYKDSRTILEAIYNKAQKHYQP